MQRTDKLQFHDQLIKTDSLNSELFLFCTFIVSLISLIIEIILLTKKK